LYNIKREEVRRLKSHKENLKERRCPKVKKSKKLFTSLLSIAMLVSCVTAIPSSATAYNLSDLPLTSTANGWQSLERSLFVQRFANYRNNAGLTEDGYFGPLTETAVKTFQRAEGLSPDGIVGTNTWTKIYDRINFVGNVGNRSIYSAIDVYSGGVSARLWTGSTYEWCRAYTVGGVLVIVADKVIL
jgi:peptidoglycan hydrolase-like protein with peptidoglycan-binding domain